MNTLASNSVKATTLNIIIAFLFRLLTFLLNAFILRRVSGEVLGVVNVRLCLLDDTVLFLSREPFRRSCLKRPEGSWKSIVNVIWLNVPNTIVLSALFSILWAESLSLPGESYQYRQGVFCIFLSTIVQSLSEAFAILGQAYFFVKLKAGLDFLWILIRCCIFAAGVYFDPDNAILWGGISHLIATCVFTSSYILFFTFYSQKLTKLERGSFPFHSLRDFLPNGHGLDWERVTLTLSFYKQGILKMVLTEGERYMMTFFDLISLTDQGVFDAVSNLGSLAARIIFRNVEEGAFLYFNQTVVRKDSSDITKEEKKIEIRVGEHLYLLLRGMTLLGFTIITFGLSYSHFVLHIYGGLNLSSGIGPSLLKTQCVLIWFLAINGITECFVFARMTKQEIDSFNFKMIWMSGVFLLSTLFLVEIFGAYGFILANIVNFCMRIIHHYSYISYKYKALGENVINPMEALFPSAGIFTALLGAGLFCTLSETYIYSVYPVYHILLGGCCFILTILFIAHKEEHLRYIFVKKLYEKLKKT